MPVKLNPACQFSEMARMALNSNGLTRPQLMDLRTIWDPAGDVDGEMAKEIQVCDCYVQRAATRALSGKGATGTVLVNLPHLNPCFRTCVD